MGITEQPVKKQSATRVQDNVNIIPARGFDSFEIFVQPVRLNRPELAWRSE